MLNHSSYYNPLTPPREVRNTPDQTMIVSVVADQDPIITPAMVREFLPLQDGQYEGTIARLIESVTRQVESYIKQDIVKKNIESMWFQVPVKAILSRGPHTDISSITVTDHEGNVTTLSSDQYTIRGMLYKQITHIQKGGELRVQYVSGYEPDTYPVQIRDAIMQEISLQFKNRQDPDTPAMTSVNNLSLEARHLLASVIRFAL